LNVTGAYNYTSSFLTSNCDYQYQNAELVFTKTDWLIATINAHPEWGVNASYCTPSEYLAAVKASAVDLPVKQPGASFFPSHNIWPNGYQLERPARRARARNTPFKM
jgi:hypothetical protein